MDKYNLCITVVIILSSKFTMIVEGNQNISPNSQNIFHSISLLLFIQTSNQTPFSLLALLVQCHFKTCAVISSATSSTCCKEMNSCWHRGSWGGSAQSLAILLMLSAEISYISVTLLLLELFWGASKVWSYKDILIGLIRLIMQEHLVFQKKKMPEYFRHF